MTALSKIKSPRTATSAMQRLFALFLGIWLFMVPMVIFSAEVIAFCEDHGTTTIPLIEEEEVKLECTTNDPSIDIDRSSTEEVSSPLPHWEELPHCSLYGEVPLRPPRRA